MIAGAGFVIVGFIGLVFLRNKSFALHEDRNVEPPEDVPRQGRTVDPIQDALEGAKRKRDE
jgi:hypothetical protein